MWKRLFCFGADDVVMFVNAGGGTVKKEGTSRIDVCGDSFFEGGDVLKTNESINDGGDMPSIYQSARFGNFSYRFNDFPPGDYLVDLHFAEIVNINGPKGMRVFDVFIQEDKASQLKLIMTALYKFWFFFCC